MMICHSEPKAKNLMSFWILHFVQYDRKIVHSLTELVLVPASTTTNAEIHMGNKDIRWHQRFSNFSKALLQLKKFIVKGAELNELEEQGMIHLFECSYELAWNTIKDFYESQGETGIQGSRDALQLAFKRSLIKDGEVWMEMLKDRNRTSHSYNEETASEIAENILTKYFG